MTESEKMAKRFTKNIFRPLIEQLYPSLNLEQKREFHQLYGSTEFVKENKMVQAVSYCKRSVYGNRYDKTIE